MHPSRASPAPRAASVAHVGHEWSTRSRGAPSFGEKPFGRRALEGAGVGWEPMGHRGRAVLGVVSVASPVADRPRPAPTVSVSRWEHPHHVGGAHMRSSTTPLPRPAATPFLSPPARAPTHHHRPPGGSLTPKWPPLSPPRHVPVPCPSLCPNLRARSPRFPCTPTSRGPPSPARSSSPSAAHAPLRARPNLSAPLGPCPLPPPPHPHVR